jgi:hypothetical protein
MVTCISDEIMEPGFYGEWVFFETEEERQDAYKYLALWKHFLMKKMKGLKQVGHDQIVLRPNVNSLGLSTLGMKIELRADE